MSADVLRTDGAGASPGDCPLCGGRNRCRLESGEAYKGPCWCDRLTVCAAALRRLVTELPEPRCLCRSCLEAIAANPEITLEVLARGRNVSSAMTAFEPEPGDYYWEAGAMVFTAEYHLRRGTCCNSGCRHCPFGH